MASSFSSKEIPSYTLIAGTSPSIYEYNRRLERLILVQEKRNTVDSAIEVLGSLFVLRDNYNLIPKDTLDANKLEALENLAAKAEEGKNLLDSLSADIGKLINGMSSLSEKIYTYVKVSIAGIMTIGFLGPTIAKYFGHPLGIDIIMPASIISFSALFISNTINNHLAKISKDSLSTLKLLKKSLEKEILTLLKEISILRPLAENEKFLGENILGSKS